MRVLNFGSLNIDKVYSVSHFVEGGETIKSINYSEYAGGKGLNQSVALIQSGIQTYHAGKVGKDGEWLKCYLKTKGINSDYTFENGSITGHAII